MATSRFVIGKPGGPGIALGGGTPPQSVRVPTKGEIIKETFTPKPSGGISRGGGSRGGGSRGGGSSGRSSLSKQPTVKIDGGTVLINGQGYSVAPSLQAKFLASKGVSVSSSVQQQIEAAAKAAEDAQKAAAAAKAAEDARRTQEALREQNRRMSNLIKEGGRETTRTYTDINTGIESDITRIKRGSESIVEIKERGTGVTRYEEYGTGKGGGSIKQLFSMSIKEPIEEVEQENVFGPVRPTKDERLTYSILNAPAPNRTGQTYDPKTNMYFKSPYGIGAGGTAIMTPPTISEKAKIDTANFAGSFTNIKDTVGSWETKIFGERKNDKRLFNEFLITQEEKRNTYEKNSNSFISNLNEKSKTFTTPEGVKTIFDFGAEQTLRGGDILATGTERVLTRFTPLKSDSKLFTTPSPIKRETAKEIISTAYMFSAFEPLMRTGTTQVQESQYIYDYKTGRYIKKSDLKDYLEMPKTDISGKKINIRDTTFSEKSNRIKDLLKSAQTNEARASVLRAAQESYGKDFVKDFVSQEFGYTVFVKPTPKTTPVKPKVQKPSSNIFIESKGAELKGISAVETSFSSFQASKVGETNWLSDSFMDTKQDTSASGKTAQVSLINLDTKQDTRQKQISLLRFDTAQDSALDTKQDSKVAQETIVSSLLKTKTAQVQKPRQDLFRDSIPTRFKTPKQPTKPSKPFIPKLPSSIKSLAKKAEKDTGLFKIFARKEGKDIEIGKASSQQEAFSILKKKLTGTLRASGFVEKAGQKVKPLSLNGEFGISKKDPFRIVEKKEKRLRKNTTGKEIQYFRGSGKSKKKSSLFGL